MSDIEAQLKKLREPFPPHHISRLPKPTRKQTDEVKANFQAGFRCPECGGWHHPKVVHLDYVGHAALTDRLLEVDPLWNWEPVSDNGVPVVDNDGGMWIKLTVCGVTRYGYGDAGDKKGANAMKERIGDALRNAAMRFGAALDLWHKGELHQSDDNETQEAPEPLPTINDIQVATIEDLIDEVGADRAAFLKRIKVSNLSELAAVNYDRAVGLLETKRK